MVCGRCGEHFRFETSVDRRVPITVAFDAGWGMARTDKGFDHVCPSCLAIDRAPRTIPDDDPPAPGHEPHQIEGTTKPHPSPPQSSWRQPTEPIAIGVVVILAAVSNGDQTNNRTICVTNYYLVI
jgi:hypothetical protein